MVVLLETSPAFIDHDTGPRHPERPARLQAVIDGATASGTELKKVAPSPAPRAALERVHRSSVLDGLEAIANAGGGVIDADTRMSSGSWQAALVAAGAGLDAVDRLERGEADAAFCVVRPPGHHATPDRPMGFCLANNIAVTAATLVDRGERVLIVDWDAHHGNGTQAAFFDDPNVLYVSFHQWPLYPGTGRIDEIGTGRGEGTTVNLPFPPGTAGGAYRAGVDEVLSPIAEGFMPTWVLLSAGFDGHRADPLADLGLTAGDYADLTERILELSPAGRTVAFLEGGYDLDALAESAGAFVAALAGERWRPEAASGGDRAASVIEAARRIHGLD